jgi:tRNA G18 (ribose-2'-O)-methylase SpoU
MHAPYLVQGLPTTFAQQLAVHARRLVGLEQTVRSTPLPKYCFPARCCLVLGAERTGIPPQVPLLVLLQTLLDLLQKPCALQG